MAIRVIDTYYSHVIIHNDFVLKIRNKTNAPLEVFLNEAHAIAFVSKNTTIPVPEVFSSNGDYILMERIYGENLEVLWPILSKDAKLNIMSQLKDYVIQMWNLKGTRIESFAGPTLEFATLAHGRWKFDFPRGPYESVAEYYTAYLKKEKRRADFTPSDVKQPIRFRHGDLEGRNIMIKDEAISAVIDWGLAGFYPEAGFWHDPYFHGEDVDMLYPIIDYLIKNGSTNRDLTRLHNQITLKNLIENMPDDGSDDGDITVSDPIENTPDDSDGDSDNGETF